MVHYDTPGRGEAVVRKGAKVNLRVVLVDDNPEDRSLVKKRLTEEFPEATFREVTRDEELVRVLQEGYDLLITDFQLRWTDGISVLKRSKSRYPDVPVIMFTGTGSEEVAVQAMKEDLDDYVLKSPKHLQKLPAVARMVLDKADTERQKRLLFRRLQKVIEQVPEGLFLLDDRKKLILSNPLADEFLRLAEAIESTGEVHEIKGRPVEDFLIDEEVPLWHEVNIKERVFEIGGKRIYLSEGYAEMAFVVRDVTEERKMEERVHSQERLAALGQLAAGIAHDFNNLLTGIIGYAEILQTEAEDFETRRRLTVILESANRAAHLIRQILDFTRKSTAEMKVIDLVDFFRELERFILRTVPENIQISFVLKPMTLYVRADKSKLYQVFTNMVVNSVDAMPAGGRIIIKLQEQFIEEPPLPYMPDSTNWAVITITDTGEGIPPEVLPHIFEPFFTTKPFGKGTGLGLSQVYGIIKQHDGYIDVKSRPGEDTEFIVYLPVSSEQQDQQGPEIQGRAPKGEGQTILVVEDNELVREFLVAMLREFGYRWLEVSNATEAIKVLKERSGEIGLVITDIVMPDMTGLELCKKIKETLPGVKVIGISGYPATEGAEEEMLQCFDGWFQKPFSVPSILRTIGELLKKRP